MPIILVKEFIKLNVNMSMVMKNVELVKINTKIVTGALGTQTLKMI